MISEQSPKVCDARKMTRVTVAGKTKYETQSHRDTKAQEENQLRALVSYCLRGSKQTTK